VPKKEIILAAARKIRRTLRKLHYIGPFTHTHACVAISHVPSIILWAGSKGMSERWVREWGVDVSESDEECEWVRRYQLAAGSLQGPWPLNTGLAALIGEGLPHCAMYQLA
jgi:hypothetical protein